MPGERPAAVAAGGNPLDAVEHRRLLDAAGESNAAAYLTGGVASRRGQTFGIEIEFCGGDRAAIGRDLYERGLTPTPEQRGYHARRAAGKWSFETDASVSGEVVSPILTDTPETWQQLTSVCDVIRTHGGYIDQRAGGHIHVGIVSSGLRHPVAQMKRLSRLYARYEDLLFRLGASAESAPFHRGLFNEFSYAKPLSGHHLARIAAASRPADVAISLPAHGAMTYTGFETRGTVEFRVNDGALDPERIQANVMVSCALVEAAGHRIHDVELPNSPLGTNLSEGDDELLRDFAGRILTTPEQRQKIYSVYARTAWQPSPSAAEDHVRRVRSAAVTHEVTRIRRHLRRVDLSSTELAQLRALVDPQSRVTVSTDTPVSIAVQEGIRWWVQRPLGNGAPMAAKWDQIRLRRASDLFEHAAVATLLQRVHDLEGRDPSEAETLWLSRVATAQASGSRSYFPAPSGAAGTVYEAWMRDESTDVNLATVRQFDAVQQRWQQYRLELESFAGEVAFITSSVEANLGRPITVQEQEFTQWILKTYRRSEDMHPTAIADPEFLDVSVAALSQTPPSATFGGRRLRAVHHITRYRPMMEAFHNMVERSTSDTEALDQDETSWLATMVLAGSSNSLDLPPPPSRRALDALAAWKEHWVNREQQWSEDRPWMRYLSRDLGRARDQWEERLRSEFEAAEHAGILEAFRDSVGRDPSDAESTWLQRMIGEDAESEYDLFPSPEARLVCHNWFQRPLPDDLPHEWDLRAVREAVVGSWTSDIDFERLLSDAIAESDGADALSDADRAWLHEFVDIDAWAYDTTPPTNRLVATIVERMIDLQASGGYAVDQQFWSERTEWWDEHREETLDQICAAELSDAYTALGRSRPRDAAQRSADQAWLGDMVNAESEPREVMRRLQPHERPSPAATALFVRWYTSLQDFDGSIPDKLTYDMTERWDEWQQADIAARSLTTLERSLRRAGADSAEDIEDWLRTFEASYAYDAPALSERSVAIIRRWLARRPAGDAEAVDRFVGQRNSRWEDLEHSTVSADRGYRDYGLAF